MVWYVRSVSTGDQIVHLPNHGSFIWNSGGSFTASFTSANADYCEVVMNGYGYAPGTGVGLRIDHLWSSGPLPTNHDFGPLFLPTPTEDGYANYFFTCTCYNNNGAPSLTSRIIAS